MNDITLDFSKLLAEQPDQLPTEAVTEMPQDAKQPQEPVKPRSAFASDVEYADYLNERRAAARKIPVTVTPGETKPLEVPKIPDARSQLTKAPEPSGLPADTGEPKAPPVDVVALEQTGRVAYTVAHAPVRLVKNIAKTIMPESVDVMLDKVFPENPLPPKGTGFGYFAAELGSIIAADLMLAAVGGAGLGAGLNALKQTRYARNAVALEEALAAAQRTKIGATSIGAMRGTVAAQLITPEDQVATGILRAYIAENPAFGEGIRAYLRDGKDDTWDQQVVGYLVDTTENFAIDLTAKTALGKLLGLKKNRKVLAAAIDEPELATQPPAPAVEAAAAAPTPVTTPAVTAETNATRIRFDIHKKLKEGPYSVPEAALEVVLAPSDNIVVDFRKAWGAVLSAHPENGVNRRTATAALLSAFFDLPGITGYSSGQQKLLAQTLFKDEQLAGIIAQIRASYKGGKSTAFKTLEQGNPVFFPRLLNDLFPESGPQRFAPDIAGDVGATNFNRRYGRPDAPLLKDLTGLPYEVALDPTAPLTGPRGPGPGILTDLPEETVLGALDKLKDMDLNAGDAVDLAIADVLPPARSAELAKRTKAAVTEGVDFGVKAVGEAAPARPTEAFAPRPGTVQPQMNPVDYLGDIVIQNNGQNAFSIDVTNAVTALFQEAPQYMDQASRVVARGKLVKTSLQRRLVEIAKDSEMLEILKDPAHPNYEQAKTKLGEAKFALDALTKLDAVLAMNIDRIRAGVGVAVNPIPGALVQYTPNVIKNLKTDIARNGIANTRDSLIAGFLNNSPEHQELVTKYVREYGANNPALKGFEAYKMDMALFPAQPDHVNIAAANAAGTKNTETVARYIAAKIVGDADGMRANPYLDSVIDALSGRWSDRNGRFAEYFVGEKDGKLFLQGDYRNLGRGPGKETDFKSLVDAEQKAFINAQRTGLLDGAEIEQYKRKIDFLSLALKNADELTEADVANILDIAVQANVSPGISKILGEGALVAAGGIDPSLTALAVKGSELIWDNVTDVLVTFTGDAKARADARLALWASWNGWQNWKRSGKTIGTGVADGFANASRVVTDVDAALSLSPEHLRTLKNVETAQRARDGLGLLDSWMRKGSKGIGWLKDKIATGVITAAELAVTNIRYQQEIILRWASRELTANPALKAQDAVQIASQRYDTYVKNSRAATAGTIYRGLYDDTKKVMPGASDTEISAVAHERFRAAWKDEDIVAIAAIHADILQEYAPTSAMAAIKDPTTRFLKSETRAWRSAFNMVNTFKDIFMSPFAAVGTIGGNIGAIVADKFGFNKTAEFLAPSVTDKISGSLLERLNSTDPRTRAKAYASASAAGFLWFMALRAAGMGDENSKSPYDGPVINPPLPNDPRLAKQLLDGGYMPNTLVVGDKQIALPPTMALAWAAMYKSADYMKKATDEAEFKEWADIAADAAILMIRSSTAFSGGGLNGLGKILGDDAPVAGTTDPRKFLTLQGAFSLIPPVAIGVEAGKMLVPDEWEIQFSADMDRRIAEAEERSKTLRSYSLDWLIPEKRTTSVGEQQPAGKARLYRTLDPTSPTYQLGVQGVRLPRIPAEVYGIDLIGDGTDEISKIARERGADSAIEEIGALMNEATLPVDPQNPTLPGAQEVTLRDALNLQLGLKRSREQNERDVAVIVDRFRNFAYDAYSDEANPRFNRAFASLYRQMKGRR